MARLSVLGRAGRTRNSPAGSAPRPGIALGPRHPTAAPDDRNHPKAVARRLLARTVQSHGYRVRRGQRWNVSATQLAALINAESGFNHVAGWRPARRYGSWNEVRRAAPAST
jgi:hypothetical protein